MQIVQLLSLLTIAIVHSFQFRSPLFATRSNGRSLQMLTVESDETTINTPTGPMRTVVLRPSAPGKYPGLIFYRSVNVDSNGSNFTLFHSEIFQLTGPILRAAQMFAGYGFVVAVPEIYHATSPGWVGGYTTEGADEGNRLKVATPVDSYDGDSKATIEFLQHHPSCTGKIGTAGFCVGGHLCLRAAMVNDGVRAVASWYPTDMHTGDGVCAGLADKTRDSFGLFPNLVTSNGGDGTEVLMIYGKQDRHVSTDGRLRTYKAMTEAGVHFEWLELNGMHAFMRDEGYRYDPMLELMTFQHAISMFNRKLHAVLSSEIDPQECVFLVCGEFIHTICHDVTIGDTKAAAPSEKGTLNAKM